MTISYVTLYELLSTLYGSNFQYPNFHISKRSKYFGERDIATFNIHEIELDWKRRDEAVGDEII